MKDRISKIIKNEQLTQSAFAKRINVSQGLVSQMCNGTAAPTDRTISDICREFGVNRIWLETGEGEPYTRLTVEEELAEIFGKVLAGSPDVKSRMIKAFARLPDEAYPIVADLVERMAAEMRSAENKETE
jgi:transcriptional regulator with XRE-family HTH domain